MHEPSASDIEQIHSRRPRSPPGKFTSSKEDRDAKLRQAEVSEQLSAPQRDFESDEASDAEHAKLDASEPAQREVNYTFGDKGSQWRMTKLKGVYRVAEETRRKVDDVALEKYGDIRDFDDAREEEREIERRKTYGKDYVGLEKPSGEFYQERKMEAGLPGRDAEGFEPGPSAANTMAIGQGQRLPEVDAPMTTKVLETTALNKLKAQMMRAKLMKAPNATQLEEEYNLAAAASKANSAQPGTVVLSEMDDRQLAYGSRTGEVRQLSGRRAQERGTVEENEDMSIEDMVRAEKRSRGVAGGEGRQLAERIAKDGKFVDDLDYMDDNATRLSKRIMKSDGQLRDVAIGDFQKMSKILDTCPLCFKDSTDPPGPPVAPVVSLATRTYLTLPTEPEISRGGAMIAPLQHRLNLLECDDDEWEEIRNFMKSLTRLYAAQNKSVIFYENAAHFPSRRGHATLNAIPLPSDLADGAPAYFKEAILSSDEQWSQHKPVIDTQALSARPGYGKWAFRKALVKEMPYFHVFFTLDGGMGHVVEDSRRWPKGDLFAREIIGGMLDRSMETIKRQGRWDKGGDAKRVEGFRRKWEAYDWTKALMDQGP
ncbi:hypothetical protein K431DRAFT_283841 [Polychaeton citri CBS 116435]|uniref:Cell cycle control protein n=1 Tax=Polychaeton citri CBS 116435 TaxID=1314669 RepID=A0A9P4US47_9PEZI|nr:hypothetical protein K431DRAFT_283841 [Polychaeton citri CBS 116435]